MPRVLLIHWHEAEAVRHAGSIRLEGVVVEPRWDGAGPWPAGDATPDALVVSLDRLPSHGRQAADWWMGAGVRRVRPLLFVGGTERAVAAARARYPTARYCGWSELPTALAGALDIGSPHEKSAGVK